MNTVTDTFTSTFLPLLRANCLSEEHREAAPRAATLGAFEQVVVKAVVKVDASYIILAHKSCFVCKTVLDDQ